MFTTFLLDIGFGSTHCTKVPCPLLSDEDAYTWACFCIMSILSIETIFSIDEITMQWKRLSVSLAGTPSYWQKSKCLRLESTPHPMILSTTSPSASCMRIVEEIEKAMVAQVEPTPQPAQSHILLCPGRIHTSSNSKSFTSC